MGSISIHDGRTCGYSEWWVPEEWEKDVCKGSVVGVAIDASKPLETPIVGTSWDITEIHDVAPLVDTQKRSTVHTH